MSDYDSIVRAIRRYVQQEMEGVCSAHDFFHIERVSTIAKKLHALEKNGDLLVVEAGAYLHESLDEKFFENGSIEDKKQSLQHFLGSLGMSEQQVTGSMFIIENIGFWKSLERGEDFSMTSELALVEDADRLESVGAIAVARTFAYGGRKNRSLYDPSVSPKTLTTKNDYQAGENTSINHFYEKLLIIKDRMHTASARRIAEQRHKFMEQYLEQFYREWNVEDIVG